MKDLKLIDELLIDYKAARGITIADLEGGKGTSVTNEAMRRLRSAWESGEMPLITLSLADYFRAKKTKPC